MTSDIPRFKTSRKMIAHFSSEMMIVGSILVEVSGYFLESERRGQDDSMDHVA